MFGIEQRTDSRLSQTICSFGNAYISPRFQIMRGCSSYGSYRSSFVFFQRKTSRKTYFFQSFNKIFRIWQSINWIHATHNQCMNDSSFHVINQLGYFLARSFSDLSCSNSGKRFTGQHLIDGQNQQLCIFVLNTGNQNSFTSSSFQLLGSFGNFSFEFSVQGYWNRCSNNHVIYVYQCLLLVGG